MEAKNDNVQTNQMGKYISFLNWVLSRIHHSNKIFHFFLFHSDVE